MLYELRVYDAVPGKLQALNDRFANHTVGFFKSHGIGMLGFWTDEIGTYNKLTYITIFENMGDRESKVNAFQADSDWQRARAETERDGPLVDRVHNSFMRLTSYSPEPRIRSNLQELRIYEALPGKLSLLHDRFANHTTALFQRHGMDVIGYWTQEVGTSNQLVYMLGYANLADRERSWSAFAADPDWQSAIAESNKKYGPLESTSHNTILRPTSYSPK